MFLHTIITAEMIFPMEPAQLKTVQQGNDFIESYEYDGKVLFSRLISTDPKKYLDQKYTVGGELKM